ncbi:MAG: glycoside hydrolase family 16 protein [Acetobacteraceae bacterium]|nr:glycoside hydrolase family 16 protein [Acetobacteraceae bacterium]
MTISDNLALSFSSDFSQFSGSGTGAPMWQTTLPHGARTIRGTGELEYYSDSSVGLDPFQVDNGSLEITATAGSSVAGTSYTSGVISTESSFSQLYGYFEMTATLPAGAGYWPAFWLLPEDLSGTDELDVMEEHGINPAQYFASVHSPSSGITSATIPTSDLTAGPHAYGMYWTPQSISYYLDGTLVAVAPTPADMNKPMFMIADLAVGKDVSSVTTFPGTMEISSIKAYAYDPGVPGPTAPLSAVVPATLAATIDRSTVVGGVAISDSAASASDTISVTISDKSLGTLAVTAAGAASVTINNGWEVQLSGSLNDVNATLQTLTYKNVPTGSAAATADTLTVSANDSSGNFDSSRISVTLASSLPTMQFITFGSQPVRVMANGHDDFVFNAGQIPNAAQNGGQADHIVNFHTAAQSAGGTSDFIALHGFDPTAQLVFDHDASVNNVPDETMQYYRVDSAAGSSPAFLVQMAGQSTAHLSNADYGFYPT